LLTCIKKLEPWCLLGINKNIEHQALKKSSNKLDLNITWTKWSKMKHVMITWRFKIYDFSGLVCNGMELTWCNNISFSIQT
jgi:hypothetical protein